ncbi:MAG TPA: efflux RND transporter permease subunit [Bryobacterales bacterium]|nr:efflux RND transporter permease subunit [Bryobacterales bacterium]
MNSIDPQQSDRRTPAAVSGEAGSRLADFSVRYPVTICMVFVLLLTLGTISIFRIPLVLLPTVDGPFLNVFVQHPNNTPLQNLETITKPLEEALSTIPGVQRLTSFASSDNARVDLNFGWDRDVGMVRNEVREKVDQIRDELPANIERVGIFNFTTDQQPILFGAFSSQRNLRQSADFLDLKVKKPLERVPGVAEVMLWGVGRREINIDLRLADIKRYRVDTGRLFQRLDAVNVNRSLGRVVDGEVQYSALTQGTLASLTDIETIPVNDRGLLLRDIADIIYEAPPRSSGSRLNGQEALGFLVRKTAEANSVETSRGVVNVLDELRNDPSMGEINVFLWFDQGKEIIRSLSGLLDSGLVGALLAVLVLACFLRRWAAAMVIALSIPFSIVAAIGFLYFSGKTLNALTMLGLMLATGMLVDNAVVVLESIYQKLEKGMDRVTAARVGTQEVITAVVAATLTSVIIFVPLIFGQKSEMSAYLSHAGFSIIFSLMCSLFISLTLIPLAMAKFLNMQVKSQPSWRSMLTGWLRVFSRPGSSEPMTPPAQPQPPVSETSKYMRGYLRLVAWPLEHRVLSGIILVPALIAGSGWLLMNKVPNMSPEALSIRDVQVRYTFSENFHYAKIVNDYVIPVEDVLDRNRERWKIKDIRSEYDNNRARTEIYFDTDSITHAELQGFRDEIEKELPDLAGAAITLGSQRGEDRTGFSANLFGDDPGTLERLALEAKAKLLERPGFARVNPRLENAEEEVQIRLRRELARQYGVSPQSVSEVLGVVVQGRRIRGFRTPEGEVDVLVQLRQEDRENLDDLRSMVVGAGAAGEPVLLSQVADLQIEKVPGQIRREERRTSLSLWAEYTGGQREVGKAAMTEVMNLLDYPPGYGWSYSFFTNQYDNDMSDFWLNIGVALFMVYFVMASLFESLAHPFAIMFSLPFALVGVALSLYLTNTPFTIMAMVGSMVLIGIVVNNGIVLVDHINNLRRKGLPRALAIEEGCRERLRPILMTATTTIVGMIPLAWGDGGMLAMQYFPMARTVMGGLVASTVLTLIVLPAYYTLFDDLSLWLRDLARSTGSSRAPRVGVKPVWR